MRKIAITGRIATGKTSVLQQFKYFGCKVFSSDEMVKRIYKDDKDIFRLIKKIVPKAIEDKKINLKLLSNFAFENSLILTELEKFIHPKLNILRNQIIKKNFLCNIKTVVFEIPLLFEKEINKEFDIIVTTTCNKRLQKRRYLLRENSTTEKFDTINKNFLEDHERFKKSHFTINTGLGKNHSMKIVKKIMNLI